ncbi:MAG: hypothetical protein QOF31_945 [Mycobacterium sp.]|jgi:hypothetical protein|nr:hypothetical protein [Mycobacterium sp.]
MQPPTKMRAILVAGAALVAAGAFATALGEETASGTAPTVSSGKMTLGDTATTTTPPTAVLIPIASPTVKATVPCGFNNNTC